MGRRKLKPAPEHKQSYIGSKVLAAATNGVVEMIQHYNGDIDSIFGHAHINPNDLKNPNTELSLKHYCSLFEQAADQTVNEHFGLWFGNTFTPEQLGPLGYLAINSPSMSSAIRNLVDYFPGHQERSILSFDQDQDLCHLHYQIVDPRISQRRQDAELSLGMFCNLFKHCIGPQWIPVEVSFEHQSPCDASQHEHCFGAPVKFNQHTNTITFRRDDLFAIMPDADPFLFSVIEPLLAARIANHANPINFITSVREHIRMHLGDRQLTLNAVADTLDIPVSVFRRQLRQHGVAFQDLVAAARKDLALKYIKQPDIHLTEVAFALGYSEQSAFSRAFRQWTGMAPRDYRRACPTNLRAD